MDAAAIRADFPVLAEQVHERPLVYLDNAATSQKPRAVIDALQTYYETYNANIHRGLHALSERATAEYEDARARVARFVNARHAHEVIFTRGTTEAINLVARGWGDENVGEGDEILLTEMEHHSNLVPWQMLARRRGAQLRYIPMDVEGRIDLEAYARMFGPRTRLVAVTHMSNVLGTITPAAEIVRIAHAHDVPVLLDAAQSIPHVPVDVQALGADFVAFSGHKMLGPTGIGVLYGRESLLDAMEPLFGGGSMIRVVELHQSSWTGLPDKLEGGTPNIAGAIGLGAAVDYLQTVGMPNVTAHEHELTEYALTLLSDLEGVRVFGPLDATDRGGVISFYVGDVHPHDVGTLLDAEGIAVRAGHHCAQPLMRKLGVAATTRASVYLYNTAAEVDCLAEGVARAKAFFA
ncbi:MAG: cysteine desulfurase [Chloroflexota bacterium]|nr:cysteine desulfurase [Chloroflexota bacterium]MDE2918821.1 cysteine desulfurase [Chloroflexota bacterium]